MTACAKPSGKDDADRMIRHDDIRAVKFATRSHPRSRTSWAEMTPAYKKGLRHVAATLDDLSETADRYAAKFRVILRSAKKAS